MYIKLICDYNKRNRQGTRRLIFNFLRTINPFPWLISLRGRGQGRGYFSVLKWHVSLSRIHCETCRSSVSFRCDTCSMLNLPPGRDPVLAVPAKNLLAHFVGGLISFGWFLFCLICALKLESNRAWLERHYRTHFLHSIWWPFHY